VVVVVAIRGGEKISFLLRLLLLVVAMVTTSR
jgi:hypothetical protein